MAYLSSTEVYFKVVQMLPYASLISLEKTGTPVYQQIANKLMWLIRQGMLKPGSALPSIRELSALLKVHRKTIVAAYAELSAQDWIETIPRKGIFVSANLPEIKPRTFRQTTKPQGYAKSTGFTLPTLNVPASGSVKAGEHRLIINDGFPDARIAPVDLLLKQYKQLNQKILIQRRIIYGDPSGSINLRLAIAKFLRETRGLNLTENNILITRGGQMAFYLAARLLLKPGSTVIVGEPNYLNANLLFQQCGAKLVHVPVDGNGIDVNKIEKLCKKKRPDLLYIIPHHHHPTTVTLSTQRRLHLLELIHQYNIPVIEDDYDYDFHYNSSPILPLASADHNGNVIYIGSLTKLFASSFKLGYMIAPTEFIAKATGLRRLIDIRGDSLMEEAFAALFRNGHMQRHIKKSVKLYHERRDFFFDLLENELGDNISISKPAGGMAFWARFNKKLSLPQIAQRASAMGLYMSDGSFYNVNHNYNALRMGFASLTEYEMKEIAAVLKKAVMR